MGETSGTRCIHCHHTFHTCLNLSNVPHFVSIGLTQNRRWRCCVRLAVQLYCLRLRAYPVQFCVSPNLLSLYSISTKFNQLIQYEPLPTLYTKRHCACLAAVFASSVERVCQHRLCGLSTCKYQLDGHERMADAATSRARASAI